MKKRMPMIVYSYTVIKNNRNEDKNLIPLITDS